MPSVKYPSGTIARIVSIPSIIAIKCADNWQVIDTARNNDAAIGLVVVDAHMQMYLGNVKDSYNNYYELVFTP